MTSISNLKTQLAFSLFENKGVFAVLIGSGVSRAAHIPTGWEITLDLIRRVATAQGVEEQPDWAAWYRKETGEEPNYSALLEELALSAEERRSILHSYIEPNDQDRLEKRKVPTEAHNALADLVAGGYIRLIITTNFDRLMENALREKGIEPTVVASTDALTGAEPFTHSACYILKLHGDYKDTRILNTDSELISYPKEYNDLLDRIFDEYGLIVCGWSAEWDHALKGAILRAPNRRYSVFWAARGEVGSAARDLINHRRARIVPITDANSFFKEIRELVETLSQTRQRDPLSTELLIGSTKRYLGKAEHRIQLGELFSSETQRLMQALKGEGFSPGAPPWNIDSHRLRIKQLESVTEPLARMAGVLGRWGDDSELSIVNDIVRTVFQHAETPETGFKNYVNVRGYPAVLVFTAYGLGLTRAERWHTLHEFLRSELGFDHSGQPTWTVERLFLWAWKGGNDVDLWKAVVGAQNYTPMSDHLFRRFEEWGKTFLTLTPDYSLLFDRFELLSSIAFFERREIDDIKEELKTRSARWTSMPIGRIGWNPAKQSLLFAELQREPMRQAILKAGFAKNNAERLQLFFEHLKTFRAY
jgi:hypothetical protein